MDVWIVAGSGPVRVCHAVLMSRCMAEAGRFLLSVVGHIRQDRWDQSQVMLDLELGEP